MSGMWLRKEEKDVSGSENASSPLYVHIGLKKLILFFNYYCFSGSRLFSK